MLVLIKSAPNTPEGKKALKLAREMAADVCLLQNGVYFAEPERLEGFCGTVYLLSEDARLRGLQNIPGDIKKIDYPELVDLLVSEDRVVGLF